MSKIATPIITREEPPFLESQEITLLLPQFVGGPVIHTGALRREQLEPGQVSLLQIHAVCTHIQISGRNTRLKTATMHQRASAHGFALSPRVTTAIVRSGEPDAQERYWLTLRVPKSCLRG